MVAAPAAGLVEMKAPLGAIRVRPIRKIAMNESKQMFTQQIRRSIGLAVHRGWAKLLLDRCRDLAQGPRQPRTHTHERHTDLPFMCTGRGLFLAASLVLLVPPLAFCERPKEWRVWF